MVTEGQQAILEHVRVFRVTTIDAVQTLFYENCSREAARVALFRLTTLGLLARTEIRNRSFYQLTPKGCATIGAPRGMASPLSAQVLIERYSVLAFSVLGEPRRRRLDSTELFAVFPELASAPEVNPAVQHYFFERKGDEVYLARAVVDMGEEATPLLAKCRRIEGAATTGGLQHIVAAKAFQLSILTPLVSKQRRLNELLWKRPLTVLTQVVVVPQMSHVLS